MALPPVGVRLVAQDANAFDSALKTAGGVLDGFGKTAISVTSAVNSAFSGMASAVGRALAPVGRFFEQVFVSVIRSVVNDAIHQLERFGRALIEAAIEGTHLQDSIERLGVSLNAVANSAFKPFTDKLGQMVDRAAPAFLGIVEAAESYLGGLGTNALVWGENMINQFAQGMWAGVGNILTVLTDIAGMITSWLIPGSPPKLLPDIDKWGTAAANEYFGGWMKADFGIFNELGSTLTNLIRSIPIPKGEQSGVIPNILGARQGIAAAVEELRTTGAITTQTMDAIVASVGTADESVRSYLESMIRLQAANDTVKAAQDELNKVTKVYQDLLKPINAEIAGISEEQQQLADEQKKSLLQLVLKDPGATLAQKRQAQLEIERLDAEKRRRALLAEQAVAVEGAKDKLDAAKTAQELAQEDFDSRKALLLMQTEQNNLLKEQLRLMEALAAAAAGGGKLTGGGGVKPGIKPFDIKPFDLGELIPGDIMDKWNAFLDAFRALWAQIAQVMQPAVNAWNKIVVPAWDRLVAAIVGSVPTIMAAITAMVGFTIASLGVSLPAVIINLGKIIDSLTQIWTNHGKTIIGTLTIAYMAVVTIVNTAMILISGIIALTLNSIAGTMDLWSAIFLGDWDEVKRVMVETVTTAMEIVQTTISGALQAIILFLGPALMAIYTMFETTWNALSTFMATKLQEISDTLNVKLNEWAQNIINGPIRAFNDLLSAARAVWEFITGHDFTAPSSGGTSGGTPPVDTGTVTGPPGTGGTPGSPIFNSSSGGNSYTYSPTYVGGAPPNDQGFAVMSAMYA